MSVINLGNLLVKLTGDSTSYEKMIAEAGGKLKYFGLKLEAVGMGMSTFLSAPLIAFGALSVNTFAKFEDAMTRSLSVMSGLSGKLRTDLTNAAIDTALKSDEPIKAAKALETLARSGLSAGQSLQMLGLVEVFSKANSIDFTKSVDILSDSQRVLGLRSKDATKNMENATKISDMFTFASLKSGASVEELGMALQQHGGAAARRYNLSLEQTLALLGSLAELGIKGQRAGTVMERLLSGGHEQGTTASWAHERLEMLKKLKPQTDAFAESMKKAQGSAGMISDQREITFTQQLQRTHTELQRVEIEIGRVLLPYLKMVNNTLKEGLNWWKNLSMETKRWHVLIAVLTAGFGPFIIMLGFVIRAMGVLQAITVRTSVAWAVWAAKLVIVAIALAAIYDSIMRLTGNKDKEIGVLKWVENFEIGGKRITDAMETAAYAYMDAWEWATNEVQIDFISLQTLVGAVGGYIYRFMLSVAAKVVDGFLGVMSKLPMGIGAAFADAQKELSKEVNNALGESLKKANEQWEAHYTKVDKVGKKSADKRQAIEDARQAHEKELRDQNASKSEKAVAETWAKVDAQKAAQFKSFMEEMSPGPNNTKPFSADDQLQQMRYMQSLMPGGKAFVLNTGKGSAEAALAEAMKGNLPGIYATKGGVPMADPAMGGAFKTPEEQLQSMGRKLNSEQMASMKLTADQRKKIAGEKKDDPIVNDLVEGLSALGDSTSPSDLSGGDPFSPSKAHKGGSNFLVTSLRRMKLGGVAGASGTGAQQVSDKGVTERLDSLITAVGKIKPSYDN